MTGIFEIYENGSWEKINVQYSCLDPEKRVDQLSTTQKVETSLSVNWDSTENSAPSLLLSTFCTGICFILMLI